MTEENIGIERLKSFVERVERLEEEKAALSEDVKEVYAEAKNVGYDVKGIKAVVKLRKMEANARAEMDSIIELYRNAVGV